MLSSNALIESRPAAAARAVVQGGPQLAHLHLRRARQELARRGRPLLAPGTHGSPHCPKVDEIVACTVPCVLPLITRGLEMRGWGKGIWEDKIDVPLTSEEWRASGAGGSLFLSM